MYVKRFVAAFGVITFLIGVGGCVEEVQEPVASENAPSIRAKASEPSQQSEVIAGVGDKELTAEQIEFLQADADDELVGRIADWWIDLQLLDAEARRRGIDKLDVAGFRARIRAQEVNADILRQQVVDAVVITDEDIRQYYELRKKIDYRLKVLPKYTFWHIAVKSLEEGRQIRTKIESGADISALAKQFSVSTDAEKGGKITGMAQNMVQIRFGRDLINSLMDASPGDIVGPVGGKKGVFEIARLHSKTEEQIKPFEEVKDAIRATVENEAKSGAIERLLESLRKEAAGRIHKSARIADDEPVEKEQ